MSKEYCLPIKLVPDRSGRWVWFLVFIHTAVLIPSAVHLPAGYSVIACLFSMASFIRQMRIHRYAGRIISLEISKGNQWFVYDNQGEKTKVKLTDHAFLPGSCLILLSHSGGALHLLISPRDNILLQYHKLRLLLLD